MHLHCIYRHYNSEWTAYMFLLQLWIHDSDTKEPDAESYSCMVWNTSLCSPTASNVVADKVAVYCVTESLPRIVSCTALRQLTSSRLLWRSPVTTLLCSTTHCHVPMLLRLGISTPRWRATPSLPMERCAQPLTWLSLDAILYYLLTYYIWNKRNITNHESNSWYISTNINVILSIHQVLYVLIT